MNDCVGVETAALLEAPCIGKHIDGPVLRWAGQMHWLTWRERASVWLGRETAETLAQRHWPARRAVVRLTDLV